MKPGIREPSVASKILQRIIEPIGTVASIAIRPCIISISPLEPGPNGRLVQFAEPVPVLLLGSRRTSSTFQPVYVTELSVRPNPNLI